jgi:hypothetical protein
MWNCKPSIMAVVILTALSAMPQNSLPQKSENPLGLRLLRYHDSEYQPGEVMAITVSIEGDASDDLKALGIEEYLPEPWVLVDVEGDGRGLPHIRPASGAPPPFEFAWIIPPAFPCTFTYTVYVPGDDYGPKQIQGFIEYRLNEGPHQTPILATEIDGPERQAPSLALLGDNPMMLRERDEWVEPGYTARDYNGEDISAQVVITGTVDTASAGAYALEYRVTSGITGLSASAIRDVQIEALPSSRDGDLSVPSGEKAYPVNSRSRGTPQMIGSTESTRSGNSPDSGIGSEVLPESNAELPSYRPVSFDRQNREEAGETSLKVPETSKPKNVGTNTFSPVMDTIHSANPDSGIPLTDEPSGIPAPEALQKKLPPENLILPALVTVVIIIFVAVILLIWRFSGLPWKPSGKNTRKESDDGC